MKSIKVFRVSAFLSSKVFKLNNFRTMVLCYFATLLLCSCKKNYYCTCTVTAWSTNTNTAPIKYYNTKTQATKECNAINKTTATETVTCELN
ncbi:MAG: hypothetical protein ACYDCN_15350 [Bacteroidia bacterium]